MGRAKMLLLPLALGTALSASSGCRGISPDYWGFPLSSECGFRAYRAAIRARQVRWGWEAAFEGIGYRLLMFPAFLVDLIAFPVTFLRDVGRTFAGRLRFWNDNYTGPRMREGRGGGRGGRDRGRHFPDRRQPYRFAPGARGP